MQCRILIAFAVSCLTLSVAAAPIADSTILDRTPVSVEIERAPEPEPEPGCRMYSCICICQGVNKGMTLEAGSINLARKVAVYWSRAFALVDFSMDKVQTQYYSVLVQSFWCICSESIPADAIWINTEAGKIWEGVQYNYRVREKEPYIAKKTLRRYRVYSEKKWVDWSGNKRASDSTGSRANRGAQDHASGDAAMSDCGCRSGEINKNVAGIGGARQCKGDEARRLIA
ncbi:hypothetical protein B0H19DRAFT_1232576 [Mycena capillaripes]|nr:hypothetical protein B0H19DRAFT_1232576 [Mycena capillaripes]